MSKYGKLVLGLLVDLLELLLPLLKQLLLLVEARCPTLSFPYCLLELIYLSIMIDIHVDDLVI